MQNLDSFLDNFLDDEEYEDLNAAKELEARLRSGDRLRMDAEEFEDVIHFYLDKDDIQKALTIAQIAVEQHPKDDGILLLQAIAFMESEQYDAAAKNVRILEKFTRHDIQVMHLKAVIYMIQGKINEGLALLDNVLRRSDEEDKTEFLFVAIGHLTKANAHEAALQCAKQLCIIMPKDAEAIAQLARCYRDCGDIEDSIDAYNASLELEDDEEVRLELGALYEKNNHPAEALQIYNDAIKKNPENIKNYWHKAAFYAAKDNYKELEKIHNVLLKRFPDFVPGWYTKGRCYADMGGKTKVKAAMECYCKTLELDPYYSDAYYAMAMLMMKNNNVKLQEEFAQRAIAIEPNNQNYYVCLISAMVTEERWDEALRVATRCLKISDKFAPVWLMISEILSRDSYAKAATSLELARECLPDNPTIILQSAIMYYKSHDVSACWRMLEKIIPENPAVIKDFVMECPESITDNEFLGIFKRLAGK
jgi:tetratricopeptide (TPR) repeat protein